MHACIRSRSRVPSSKCVIHALSRCDVTTDKIGFNAIRCCMVNLWLSQARQPRQSRLRHPQPFHPTQTIHSDTMSVCSTVCSEDTRQCHHYTHPHHRHFSSVPAHITHPNMYATTQVASHAQKYFIRLNTLNKKDKRRASIHDITSVGGNSGAATHQNTSIAAALPSQLQLQQQHSHMLQQGQQPLQVGGPPPAGLPLIIAGPSAFFYGR